LIGSSRFYPAVFSPFPLQKNFAGQGIAWLLSQGEYDNIGFHFVVCKLTFGCHNFDDFCSQVLLAFHAPKVFDSQQTPFVDFLTFPYLKLAIRP